MQVCALCMLEYTLLLNFKGCLSFNLVPNVYRTVPHSFPLQTVDICCLQLQLPYALCKLLVAREYNAFCPGTVNNAK